MYKWYVWKLLLEKLSGYVYEPIWGVIIVVQNFQHSLCCFVNSLKINRLSDLGVLYVVGKLETSTSVHFFESLKLIPKFSLWKSRNTVAISILGVFRQMWKLRKGAYVPTVTTQNSRSLTINYDHAKIGPKQYNTQFRVKKHPYN